MEQSRRLLPLLAAGGLVVAAVYAAGALGPSVAETTTTSSTIGASLVDEAISGPVLDWRMLSVVGEGNPVAFGSFGDGYVLVAVDGETLVGWHSADLTTWEALPMSGLQQSDWWSNVVIGEAGIVAIGELEGVATAWVSESGEAWQPIAVPETEHSNAATQISGALWHDGSLVLYGNDWNDPVNDLLAALPTDLHEAVSEGDLWPSLEETVLILYGPMDLPVYRATLADLGVDELPTEYGSSAHIWISDDRASWESVTPLSDGYLNIMFEAPDGSLVASGGSDRGTVSLSSVDGRHWEETFGTVEFFGTATWHDRLIHMSTGGMWRSEDGLEWDYEVIPRGLFPPAPDGEPWSVDRVVAGDLGLVALGASWDWSDVTQSDPPPLTLEQNGYRLERSWTTGLITVLDTTGQTVLVVRPGLQDIESYVTYDSASRALTFAHPTEGTPMITVTTDEWQRAMDAAWATVPGSQPTVESLLVFTTDGETWSTTAPEWLGMDPTWGTHGPVIVEDDRALAVATSADAQTIALWEGTLPD